MRLGRHRKLIYIDPSIVARLYHWKRLDNVKEQLEGWLVGAFKYHLECADSMPEISEGL